MMTARAQHVESLEATSAPAGLRSSDRVVPPASMAVPAPARVTAGNYLDSPQFHRDRAADLAAGNTAGLTPQQAAYFWAMHREKM